MNSFKLTLALIIPVGLTSPSWAELRGRAQLLAGTKTLDNQDWGELDSQDEWGLELDLKQHTWPVWVNAGFLQSRDKISVVQSASPLILKDVEGKTTEFHLGVKKDFYPIQRLRLSVSGGPTLIDAQLGQLTTPFQTDSDRGIGYWGTADILIFIGQLGLGLSYRFSQADVDLLERTRDAGGRHWVFSAGVAW